MELIKKLLLAAVPVTAVAASLLLFCFQAALPANICLFRNITGLYCAGCGAVHAYLSLLQGDILKALDYNAYFILLIPVAVYLYAALFIKVFFKKNILPKIKPVHGLFVFLALTAVFMAARNISLIPFAFLKP